MKCITLLLDGASDRSYDVLDGKTPLQYAHTPNLDLIASKSQCGLMTIYQEGVALGTDMAHTILLGYDLKEYPSRTILDAIGEGLDLDEDALYLRCSIATVEKQDGYLLKRRFTPDLSDAEIIDLSQVLNMTIDGYDFEFIHSYDSHGFIKVSGPVSDQISDSDPFYRPQYVMTVEAFETQSPQAIQTAAAINKYIKRSFDLLSSHPVNDSRLARHQDPGNIIMTKWAGTYKPCECFEMRNGMTGKLIGSSKLLEGLSQYLGLTYQGYIEFDDAIQQALTAKEDYIHLHTKSPDTAAHKKDPFLKVKALEAIDRTLKPLMDMEGLLIVTSDHSTPCASASIHSGESVAFMAKGPYVRRDNVQTFDEVACSSGSIHLKGADFMTYIINATDRGYLYHLRQGKQRRKYQIKDVNKLV